MYNYASNEFKSAVDTDKVIATAKIVFTNPDLIIEAGATENLESSIVELTITDKCYDSGKLIGTAMVKEAEIILMNKDNLDLSDKEFELYVGVEIYDGSIEYIPYGKYIITNYKDMKSSNKFKIIAYDYMSKLNGYFEDLQNFNPAFPITLKMFKQQLLTACGIETVNQLLANDTFLIEEMPNFDGMTIRAILGKIAELQGTFAKINRENKMQFYLKTNTQEVIDGNSMNSTLEIDKMYRTCKLCCFSNEKC